MRKVILLTVVVIVLVSCNNEGRKQTIFKISGSISQDSLNTKEIILLTQTKEVQDTAVIVSNRFKFNGMVSEPTNAGLLIGEKMLQFPLINDEIIFNIIDIDKNEFKVQYQNSRVSENLQSYFEQESHRYINNYKLFEAQKIKNDNDNVKYAVMKSEDSLALSFINQLITKYKNSSDLAGLSIIVNDLRGLIGTRNHPKKIEEIFQLLPDAEQNGFYGTKIKTYLEQSGKIALGQKINFDFIDISGESYSLNEFQDKLILLEFWASWCGPCIAQIPQLKQISKKSDKIQIISITIDDNLIKWKNKIIDLEMDWINIHYKQQDIDLKNIFFITGVPYNILLSQDGEILRKNINMTELLVLIN